MMSSGYGPELIHRTFFSSVMLGKTCGFICKRAFVSCGNRNSQLMFLYEIREFLLEIIFITYNLDENSERAPAAWTSQQQHFSLFPLFASYWVNGRGEGATWHYCTPRSFLQCRDLKGLYYKPSSKNYEVPWWNCTFLWHQD